LTDCSASFRQFSSLTSCWIIGNYASHHLQSQFIQVLRRELCIQQGSLKRLTAALHKPCAELFELGTRYFNLQVLGTEASA